MGLEEVDMVGNCQWLLIIKMIGILNKIYQEFCPTMLDVYRNQHYAEQDQDPDRAHRPI